MADLNRKDRVTPRAPGLLSLNVLTPYDICLSKRTNKRGGEQKLAEKEFRADYEKAQQSGSNPKTARRLYQGTALLARGLMHESKKLIRTAKAPRLTSAQGNNENRGAQHSKGKQQQQLLHENKGSTDSTTEFTDLVGSLAPQRKTQVGQWRNPMGSLKRNLVIRYSLLRQHVRCVNETNAEQISMIVYNDQAHIVAVFKDYLIYDDAKEFLQRFYSKEEGRERLRVCVQKVKGRWRPCRTLLDVEYIFAKAAERKQKVHAIKDQEARTRQEGSTFFHTRFLKSLAKEDLSNSHSELPANSLECSRHRESEQFVDLLTTLNDHDKDITLHTSNKHPSPSHQQAVRTISPEIVGGPRSSKAPLDPPQATGDSPSRPISFLQLQPQPQTQTQSQVQVRLPFPLSSQVKVQVQVQAKASQQSKSPSPSLLPSPCPVQAQSEVQIQGQLQKPGGQMQGEIRPQRQTEIHAQVKPRTRIQAKRAMQASAFGLHISSKRESNREQMPTPTHPPGQLPGYNPSKSKLPPQQPQIQKKPDSIPMTTRQLNNQLAKMHKPTCVQSVGEAQMLGSARHYVEAWSLVTPTPTPTTCSGIGAAGSFGQFGDRTNKQDMQTMGAFASYFTTPRNLELNTEYCDPPPLRKSLPQTVKATAGISLKPNPRTLTQLAIRGNQGGRPAVNVDMSIPRIQVLLQSPEIETSSNVKHGYAGWHSSMGKYSMKANPSVHSHFGNKQLKGSKATLRLKSHEALASPTVHKPPRALVAKLELGTHGRKNPTGSQLLAKGKLNTKPNPKVQVPAQAPAQAQAKAQKQTKPTPNPNPNLKEKNILKPNGTLLSSSRQSMRQEKGELSSKHLAQKPRNMKMLMALRSFEPIPKPTTTPRVANRKFSLYDRELVLTLDARNPQCQYQHQYQQQYQSAHEHTHHNERCPTEHYL